MKSFTQELELQHLWHYSPLLILLQKDLTPIEKHQLIRTSIFRNWKNNKPNMIKTIQTIFKTLKLNPTWITEASGYQFLNNFDFKNAIDNLLDAK